MCGKERENVMLEHYLQPPNACSFAQFVVPLHVQEMHNIPGTNGADGG